VRASLLASVLAALAFTVSSAAAGKPSHHTGSAASHAKPKAAPHGKASGHASKPGRRGKVGPSPAALAAQRRGKSVGSPTNGKLDGGAHLETAPHLRIVPAYTGSDVRWGVGPLVSMIDRAAKLVRKQFPDAVLSVGHLSKRGGGEIDRHASHESGRDADIAFYVKNQAGKPIFANHFVPFAGDGTAPTWPGAKFDDARNWALVSAMVTDPGVHISHIFVATPIRARLLAFAARVGASPSIRRRASEVMAQPRGALPHDDHFHVRISCPSGMGGCVENPQRKRAPSHGAASASTKRAPHGRAHAPASKASAPASPAQGQPKPAPKPAEPAADEPSEKDKTESSASTPTLGPEVPGLDSALIPAKIEGPATPPPPVRRGVPTPPPRQDRGPDSPPISDPDGILDN
jgi:penicillin-insensitive murein DD-endopeptidase